MRNLNVDCLMSANRPLRNPQKPMNKEAMKTLAEYHVTIAPKTSQGGVSSFTQENTLFLGGLYQAAWGVLPSAGRLKTSWCMPDYNTVVKLFGSIASYHAAIRLRGVVQDLQGRVSE